MTPPVPLTPLDPWTASRIGQGPGSAPIARQALEAYQVRAVQRLLAHVRSKSRFYATHLARCRPEDISRLEDLGALPLTREADLRTQGTRLLCVPQDEVARIVSLHSSGTTGPAKRLHFSAADLELTLEFFQHGMSTFARPGQVVLVLLPGESPDSTGDLLARALVRLGARAVVHGLLREADAALEAARQSRAQCVVGFPVHVLALAERAARAGIRLNVRDVLLCSDYIPASLARRLERLLGCRVFAHYGAVETGLGGGVECLARCGCHVREADLLVEVVHPESGAPLPPGQWGELVVTTLTREAMPLVRYATGDQGRILAGTCACGSTLARLDKVQGRMGQMPRLASGSRLSMARLDEILFDLEGVLDYSAVVDHGGPGERLCVRLSVTGRDGAGRNAAGISGEALTRLADLPELRVAVRQGSLALTVESATSEAFQPLSPAKRSIQDMRGGS